MERLPVAGLYRETRTAHAPHPPSPHATFELCRPPHTLLEQATQTNSDYTHGNPSLNGPYKQTAITLVATPCLDRPYEYTAVTLMGNSALGHPPDGWKQMWQMAEGPMTSGRQGALIKDQMVVSGVGAIAQSRLIPRHCVPFATGGPSMCSTR